MRQLKFVSKAKRESLECRKQAECRDLYSVAKAASKGQAGVRPIALLKDIYKWHSRAAANIEMIDGIIAGEMGPISDQKKQAFLGLRNVLAAVVAVTPFKVKADLDV